MWIGEHNGASLTRMVSFLHFFSFVNSSILMCVVGNVSKCHTSLAYFAIKRNEMVFVKPFIRINKKIFTDVAEWECFKRCTSLKATIFCYSKNYKFFLFFSIWISQCLLKLSKWFLAFVNQDEVWVTLYLR